MIHYTDSGHGKIVIFIHGFCENLKIWSAFEEELSKFMRVICVDLPGFGESRFSEESVSMEWFASQIIELTRELNISTFSVVGHSLGAYVALALAETHAHKLDSLVLFHSTAYADSDLKKENRDKAADFIKRNGLDKYMNSFVEPLFAEENRIKCKENIAFLIAEGKKSDPDAVISTMMAMKLRKERVHVLKSFPKPILFIAGENDLAVPLADSQKQAELSPNIQSFFLKNCGHMGMFEKPVTCLTRMKEFYFS